MPINSIMNTPSLQVTGIMVVTCAVVCAYFYATLPHLKENFMSQKATKAIKNDYAELKKKYQKNRSAAKEANNELKDLKFKLNLSSKSKDEMLNRRQLMEFDIEKSEANHNKIKAEVVAIQTYYANLQKEFIILNKELDNKKEEFALDKAKCSAVDTNLIKLKKDQQTVKKEVEAAGIQLNEQKKQLALFKTKNDPLADTLTKVLVEKQKEKAVMDKKLAEMSAKLKSDLGQQEKLKRKLSIDEDKLTKLRKQHGLYERQLVQIETKIKKEAEDKKRKEVELKQIKQTIATRDNMNKNLQKDVANIRNKYNGIIKQESATTGKINALRSKNITESMEIKKLQDTIAVIKKTQAEVAVKEAEEAKKKSTATNAGSSELEKNYLLNIKYVRIAPSGEGDSTATQNHNTPLELSQIVVRDETGANIAKQGKITASSTSPAAKGVQRLINGDERSTEWTDVWTQQSLPAWVEIELPKVANISEVVVYPRESTKYYLNGMAAVVWFLDSDKKLVLKRSIPGINLNKRVLKDFGYNGTPGNVRYLRIERTNGPNATDGYIQLHQLAAYDLDGRNVAKFQKVTAKNAHRFPEHIVDGDLDYNRNVDKLYHSHGGRPDTWLEVKLYKPTALRTIKFYNRGDCCHDAMLPFKLVLLDSNRNELSKFNFTKDLLQIFNVTGKASEKV